MTRKEASDVLDDYDVNFAGHTAEEVAEAFDVAFKALEQEPCEDAISRHAVDTLVDELARAISDERCHIPRGRSTATIMQNILDLPPVTPAEKVGHWIEHYDWIGRWWECSKCGAHGGEGMKYCMFCGAKMEGVEE